MAGVWLRVVIGSSRQPPLPVSLEFLLPRVSSGAHLGALRRGSASVSWPALRLPAVKLFLEARDYVGCFFSVSSYVFQVIGKEFAALSPCCSRLSRSAWHRGQEDGRCSSLEKGAWNPRCASGQACGQCSRHLCCNAGGAPGERFASARWSSLVGQGSAQLDVVGGGAFGSVLLRWQVCFQLRNSVLY